MRRLLLPLLTCMLWTPTTRGDWLVTSDGTRVETDGEWRVEGRQVLFTLPNGTLSAMRLSEVDLESSREATEAAVNEAEAAPAEEEAERPKPEPVLVLTNKDIPQARSEEAESGKNAGAGDSEVATPSASGLRVIEWNAQQDGGGTMMIGRLENATGRLQNGIGLIVEIRDDAGETIAAAVASLSRGSLIAGGITVFRARFPELPELPGTPHFVTESSEFTVRGGQPDEAETDA